jgi:PAS domain S-box-containing protein
MTIGHDGRHEPAGSVVDATSLRQRAEEKARAMRAQDLALSPEEAQRLLHELRVRQIELDMENEELRRALDQLDVVMDNIPAYVAYTDPDLNLLHANHLMAEWWGYAKEQVVGKAFAEIAHPGGYERNAPYLRQAAATRQTVTYEVRQESASGQRLFSRMAVVPHMDEKGSVRGLVVLALDVTAQRQAEEALRASEERYRLVVENMGEGLVVVDEDGLVTYVNDSLCTMVGLARDQLLGQRSLTFFPSEGQEEHLGWLARRRAGFSDTYEAVFQRRDSSSVPVLISAGPLLDSEGNYRGSVAVCTDISERVAAEEMMRRRVEELSALNRIAHAVSATAELPGALAQASQVIAELFAAHCVHIIWPAGEEPGSHLHVACEPVSGQPSPPRLEVPLDQMAVLDRLLREGRAQVVADVRSYPLSDLARDLLVHPQVRSVIFVPLLIGGTAVGLLWVARDQTERVFAENERALAEIIALDLAAAIESARLSREAKRAAVAEERHRLAHELHDSITQTLYSVSILAEALPRVLERDLEDAKRNARHMRQVVLGALAEMRTLLFELRPDALDEADLGVLLRQLADSLRTRGRIDLDLKIDGKVELPLEVKIGLYRIAQEACNNIARHARATHVTVTLQDLPYRLRLTIQDDGEGFDPADVSAAQMGLRIMRERAEAIGLHLAIDSQIGLGTRIAVTWPKDEGQKTEDK